MAPGFFCKFAHDMENELKYICFDAEMTDRGELLELSIFTIDSNEIYHQYFKPFYQKRWRTDIHHITPEMVKDKPLFSACRRSIQRIVDHCEYVIGFAVDNDIRTLTAEGIKNLDQKRVIEIRDWYWLCIGNDNGVDINGGPGLQSVAPELGIEFGESHAHSASGDTEVTLKCFKALVERFNRRFVDATTLPSPTLDQSLELFEKVYAAARRDFRKQRAKGEFYLVASDKGHKLAKTAPSGGTIVGHIEIADRFKAEFEIRKKFNKRTVEGDGFGVYRLKDADIQWFKNYTNTFDEEDSEFFKKMLRMRRFN